MEFDSWHHRECRGKPEAATLINRSSKRPRGAGQTLDTCPLLAGPSTTLLFLVGNFIFLIGNLLPKLPLEFCSLALPATTKRRTSPPSLLCSVYRRPNIFFLLENLQTPGSPLCSSRRSQAEEWYCFHAVYKLTPSIPGSSSLIKLCFTIWFTPGITLQNWVPHKTICLGFGCFLVCLAFVVDFFLLPFF